MLWLLFHVGSERFAVRGDQVDEVLPVVELHRTARCPRGLAGAFSFHGRVTPVIDLAEWLLDAKCPLRLSSRMILIQSEALRSSDPEASPPAAPLATFALLAERVIELRPIDQPVAATSAFGWTATLSLGPVIADDQGLLQLLDIDQLIAAARQQSLLSPEMTAANVASS